MKTVGTILLAVLILFPSFYKTGIIISFNINQDYIAKNLCVQRNIKNNCCHGCCQLKKRLDENDKHEQKQMPRGSNEKTNFSIFLINEVNTSNSKVSLKNIKFNPYICFLSSFFKGPVFHPPKEKSI